MNLGGGCNAIHEHFRAQQRRDPTSIDGLHPLHRETGFRIGTCTNPRCGTPCTILLGACVGVRNMMCRLELVQADSA